MRIMPAVSNSRALDVYGGVTKTSTFNGRSFPKRDGIDCQIVDYNGNSHQKWVLQSTTGIGTRYGIDNSRMWWQGTFDSPQGSATVVSAKTVQHDMTLTAAVNLTTNRHTIQSISSFGYLDNSNPTANDYQHGLTYSYNINSIQLNGTNLSMTNVSTPVYVESGWIWANKITHPYTTVTIPFTVTIKSIGTMSSPVLDIAFPHKYFTTNWTME